MLSIKPKIAVMKIKHLMVNAMAILSAICLPLMLQAQGNPGTDPDPIPLDGGLTMLIAAGVAYGAKKAYDKRKKDKQEVGNKEVE